MCFAYESIELFAIRLFPRFSFTFSLGLIFPRIVNKLCDHFCPMVRHPFRLVRIFIFDYQYPVDVLEYLGHYRTILDNIEQYDLIFVYLLSNAKRDTTIHAQMPNAHAFIFAKFGDGPLDAEIVIVSSLGRVHLIIVTADPAAMFHPRPCQEQIATDAFVRMVAVDVNHVHVPYFGNVLRKLAKESDVMLVDKRLLNSQVELVPVESFDVVSVLIS